MLRIIKSIVARDTLENSAKDSAEKFDHHLEDVQRENSLQEDSLTHLSDEEKEQKLAQYKLWISWIGQRQEALDQIELKLRRMRKIAKEAMEPEVSNGNQEALNNELQRLEREVQQLDKVSREKEMMMEEMEQAVMKDEHENP